MLPAPAARGMTAMQVAGETGELFRLYVSANGHSAVFGPRYYTRYEQAQARVAEAVRQHGRTGTLQSIILQRGTRESTPVESNTATVDGATTYYWFNEKAWGPEVIDRILRQNGIDGHVPVETPSPPSPPAKPKALPAPPSEPVAPSTSAPAIDPASDPSRPATVSATSTTNRSQAIGEAYRPAVTTNARTAQHKDLRWRLVATTVMVVAMMVTLIMFQTGGRPLSLLSGIVGERPTVKHELPFDARTSFPQREVRQERAMQDPRPDGPLPERQDS